MRLYELLVGFNASIKGYIWCRDGSLIKPRNLRNSGKEAYGYVLSDTTVARLTRSTIGMSWAPSSSPWYDANFTGAQSLADGVSNSNYLKSIDRFNSTDCPAVHYGCTRINAGKVSYMPSRDELLDLYDSIMSGDMRMDLIIAGLYDTCNYRNASNDTDIGWGWIWSSSQGSDNSHGVWQVYCSGLRGYSYKNAPNGCVIPFFKVQ